MSNMTSSSDAQALLLYSPTGDDSEYPPSENLRLQEKRALSTQKAVSQIAGDNVLHARSTKAGGSEAEVFGSALSTRMDLHAALASILRPLPTSSSNLPFHHLLTLASLEPPILPLAQLPEQLSPKKSRLEDSSSPLSSSTVSSSLELSSSPISSPRRKLPQPIPDEKKDVTYYERRRKNNDAAKRSRDLRRQKEEATSRRAAQLEQENAQLRGQLALMKSEMANIQLLLLSRTVGSTAQGTKSNDSCSL